MGVTYKLLSKVKRFILRKKRTNPRLSCRKLSDLVKKKFALSLGKSQIAKLLKKEGISSPLGRKRKRAYLRKAPLAYEGLGNFFLKCADLDLRGISWLKTTITKKFPNLNPSYLQGLNETLLYLLLEIKDLEEIKNGSLPELIPLIVGKNYKYSTLVSYYQKLQRLRRLNLEFFSQFVSSLEEGLYLEFLFRSRNKFLIDAQMHSLWSEKNIPFDFSRGINKIKEDLENFFSQNLPLVLQNCPGFERPPEVFFYFLRAMEAKEKIEKISIFSQEEKILDFQPRESKKGSFIIGLWPWQYRKIRQIKELSDYKDFFLPLLFKENFKISEAEVKLEDIKLRGSILRAEEKIKIILLTNILDRPLEEITLRYLEHWPNLEEGFEDFSKKIELYTYKETKKIESTKMEFSPSLELKEIFDFWLKNLNSYCQRHFFPLEYRNLDFQEIKKRFYGLLGKIEKKQNYILLRLFPPQDYPFLKDLIYSCRRVNESDITTPKAKRIYFEVS